MIDEFIARLMIQVLMALCKDKRVANDPTSRRRKLDVKCSMSNECLKTPCPGKICLVGSNRVASRRS